MNGSVSALTVYDNQLIAGGRFTTAGGTTVNRIAAWDGSSWSELGSGIGGSAVTALTVYDGKLIAGGFFYTAGGTAANRVARWDGSTWQPLGSGMNAYVNTLTVYDNQLIAGGDFTTAGGTAANYIAAWNKPAPDTNADGDPDWNDPDDDNDGIADGSDADPLDSSICEDADSDGCDDCAVGVDGFGPLAVYDPSNDGPDADADGICDVGDLCTDTDGDGYGDPGFPADTCATDNCPHHYNAAQTDSDGDGRGNLCDNCWLVANSEQLDTDEDCPARPYEADPRCGDACETCCVGRVGDANGSGEDEPTISDISVMIDAKFITGTCDGKIQCLVCQRPATTSRSATFRRSSTTCSSPARKPPLCLIACRRPGGRTGGTPSHRRVGVARAKENACFYRTWVVVY